MGAPGELSATLIRTWTSHQEPYRIVIVQDISRIPATVLGWLTGSLNTSHHGGIVPDEELRHGRRAERGTRPFKPHHDCQAAVSRLCMELAAEVECARMAVWVKAVRCNKWLCSFEKRVFEHLRIASPTLDHNVWVGGITRTRPPVAQTS